MPASNLSPSRTETAYHCNGLHFHEMRYAHDSRNPRHVHEEAHLILFLKGTVEEVRGQQTFVRTPSTLMLLPAEEPHATRFLEGVKTFEIVLPTQWAERVRQYSALVDSSVTYQNGLPIWLAMRLYREFQCRDEMTPLILEGRLLELLAEMSRETTPVVENACPRWLKQARDFLHAHFTESLSLDAVAVTVGVHPAHLTRAFRQHFHATIGNYVRRLRVEYACHLLSTSDLPLAQVALDTGFADQSHFCRTFKSLTGMPPAQFQKISRRAG